MEKEEAQTTAKQNLLPRASETGQTVKEGDRDCKSFSAGETGWRTSERDFFLFFLRIYS